MEFLAWENLREGTKNPQYKDWAIASIDAKVGGGEESCTLGVGGVGIVYYGKQVKKTTHVCDSP